MITRYSGSSRALVDLHRFGADHRIMLLLADMLEHIPLRLQRAAGAR